MRRLLCALVLLIAVPALAVPVNINRHERRVLTNKIASTSTLASSRSFTVSMTDIGEGSYGLATIYTQITDANDSETGVSLACTASEDGNSTDFRIPACVWDAVNTRYNCEAGPLFWNPTDETSPKKQIFRIDVEGLVSFECTFSFTGGAAGDTISVPYVVLSSKG